MKLTKFYSQSGCIFEKKLEKAYEVCKCYPWYYPQLEKTLQPFCNPANINCFTSIMNNHVISTTETCLELCNKNTYQSYIATEPLKTETVPLMTISPNAPISGWSVINYLYFIRDSLPEQYQRNYAMITLVVEENTYHTYYRDIKTPIADKVALIGGTLGLFTGISLLSLIEVLFWIIKFFGSKLMSGMTKQNSTRSAKKKIRNKNPQPQL